MAAKIIIKNRGAELDMELKNDSVVRFQLDDHRYIDVRMDGDDLIVRTDGSLAVFPVSANALAMTVAQ